MDQLNRQVSRMYFCVRHSRKLVKPEVFLQFCVVFRTGASNDDFHSVKCFKNVLSYLECCLNLCRLILGCAVKFLCAACSVITRELESSPFYQLNTQTEIARLFSLDNLGSVYCSVEVDFSNRRLNEVVVMCGTPKNCSPHFVLFNITYNCSFSSSCI